MAFFDFLNPEATSRELFAFNLMPPKTKEEIEGEIQRKKALLYSVMAPVFTIFFTAIILLVNALVFQPNLTSWISNVTDLKQTLANPSNELGQLRVRNGELKIKTDFITDPIDKNVDFNKIFEIGDGVFSTERTSTITSYGRENDGQFIINAVTTNADQPSIILGKFKELDEVEDASLRLVQKPQDSSSYRFSIGFIVKVLETEDVVQPL